MHAGCGSRGSELSRRALRRSGERGLTLLETLITVALLTVAMVGIVGGIAAAQHVSTVNQDQSQLEVAMRQFADYVRDSTSSGLAYQPCAQVVTPVTAGAAGSTTGANPYSTQVSSLPITGVGNWGFTNIYESSVGAHNLQADVGALWTSGCTPSHGVGDYGVQEITLRVFDKTGARSITRTVWKSVAWCYQGQLQSPNPTVTAC